MLRSRGITVLGHPLTDHARIGTEDIVFADGKPVLMTEKDAVKCKNLADARHWYVPVGAYFEADESTTLLGIVTQSIAKRAQPPRGSIDG
jgi:tetraacyldisaccharide-1-P 4'-kinase